MVRMIINLVTLEEDLKNIHHYVDHLAPEVPGRHDNPAVADLKDRLNNMEIRLHEAIRQWPQLGMDITC
ncbi:MAG: hypothetical protein FJ126_08055 [Deltaproteobacteria bacterium]|nr:hypothetical protein [Deltaproteobacteria bacterium]